MEPPLAGAAPRLRLRLICLTDLHANLYPYDYYRDRPDNSVGLARAASLIAGARAECSNCLLFDNGDILQGTPLGDVAAAAIMGDASAIHPVIAAMNRLDYAVATPGNHEFNYGLEALERAYAQARFPIVCCNVLKLDGSPWFPPSIVVERDFADEFGDDTPTQDRRDRRRAAADRAVGRGAYPRTPDDRRYRRGGAGRGWPT